MLFFSQRQQREIRQRIIHIINFSLRFIPARSSKYPAMQFLILFLKNMSRKQLIKFKHSVYQTEQKYGSTYEALYEFKV